MNNQLKEKYNKLREFFIQAGNVALAFSGGVDSTLLLKVASIVLGKNVTAYIVRSALLSDREYKEALDFCIKNNFQYKVIDYDCFSLAELRENKKDRCYFCKKNMFGQIKKFAFEAGINCICEGSNTDDTKDYRPGMKAIEELKIQSPLKDCGFSKDDIRRLSKKLKLKGWNKPSFACLASRIPYGQEINEKKLNIVEKAENLLFKAGLTQVRVRLCDLVSVRIEVYIEEIPLILKKRQELISELKALGLKHISLDLEGFRSGSMNDFIVNR
ncbi:ATP-dependent sacrificial sulfur transferase LarE [Treponema sp.]|uniref:ATP-dependent sacrificial sulfur transferase LarE n=1 Tax=Treponema sp. TaxID=166 RepID=UPI0025FB425D|nr:ATP-dependent sacrificial sulfur transferase LarE [Treponema sp.]MCR5217609.1 ATP-dependent sacrificial sulfur transferase LarE [Treponema sp.]